MSKPIRVLLADDHRLVRAGIRSLLQGMAGVEVVGEADDGQSALKLVQTHRPDIVLMDIAMSGLNGLEATTRISIDFPDTRVIILSMHANEEYVIKALRAGAAGYLLKDAATTELSRALKSVLRGNTYLSGPISQHVIEKYRERIVEEKDPLQHLTTRQREVLQLIAEGRTTKEIAEFLKISAKTVETHRSQLMDRLKIGNVPGLVRYAIRMGIVSSEQ